MTEDDFDDNLDYEYLNYPGPTPETHCHFCNCYLLEDNNAMVLSMSGKPPAPMGFGWISVIVEPFNEVACCDICFNKPTAELPGFIMA